MEIVPADSALLDPAAYIDYSFVTGESKPVKVKQGELVYAGGRLIGAPVKLVVEKKTSQSHLTSLWNHEAFKKAEESKPSLSCLLIEPDRSGVVNINYTDRGADHASSGDD